MARTNALIKYRIEHFDETSRYGPQGIPRPQPQQSPAANAAGGRDDSCGSSSEEVIDLAYIRENKPSTRIVREFMRTQATSVSAAGQDDFLL